jgi:hypothetical protein
MEIDLKKTPLSEIDLTKIDYDKSYVEYDGAKIPIYSRDCIHREYSYWNMRGWHFLENGTHYAERTIHATLHLFYKEEKFCKTCKYEEVDFSYFPYSDCKIREHSHWQPKESVSIGGGWFVEDSSKKKNTISESINKRVKELQNDSMIDYVSMNHIAQHGVNDSLKEVYCFIKAIIEYLEVTNANE